MSWHNMDMYVTTLTAATVNHVSDNIAYLKEQAELKGVTVREIAAANASLDTIIAEVGNVLQRVETGITVIDEDVAESLYYGDSKNIGRYFSLEDYQRWVLCLNDLYDIIVNEKGQWGQIYLTQEENQPDVQIDENDVYIRGDLIA